MKFLYGGRRGSEGEGRLLHGRVISFVWKNRGEAKGREDEGGTLSGEKGEGLLLR